MTEIPLECVYCLARGTAHVDIDGADMSNLVAALASGLPKGWTLVKKPSPLGALTKVACRVCSRVEVC
jgi:hypothetical protein